MRRTFAVHREDFVLAKGARLSRRWFEESRVPYDIAIANPPYFKLQKQDPRALAAAEIVHGQPNIYELAKRYGPMHRGSPAPAVGEAVAATRRVSALGSVRTLSNARDDGSVRREYPRFTAIGSSP